MSERILNSIQKNLFEIIYVIVLIALLTILTSKEKIIQNDNFIMTGMEQSDIKN